MDGTFAASGTHAAEIFPRRANEAGIALIREFEGLRLEAYLCPGGIFTVGYGHTRSARAGMKITRDQADALLDADLRVYEHAVARHVLVPLTDNQFAALVSFTFNVGITNFIGSKLLRLLNRGWYEQVPAQLSRWVHARGEAMGGLARRRRAEAMLWNTQDRA
ncbi:MAG: glycoside hydrolase family protein [Alphaproteobacteria bacterium]|nr:glycoside hydrolase family protein [Alphaproteobacteria bacterium]